MFGGMGRPAPQVSPPQGGFPAQPQSSPMQGQPTPDMMNNFKMKFQEEVQRMGNFPTQGQPSQGGLFGNMSAYTSPAANFNQQQNTNQGQVSSGLQGLQGLLKGNLLNTSSTPYTGPQY